MREKTTKVTPFNLDEIASYRWKELGKQNKGMVGLDDDKTLVKVLTWQIEQLNTRGKEINVLDQKLEILFSYYAMSETSKSSLSKDVKDTILEIEEEFREIFRAAYKKTSFWIVLIGAFIALLVFLGVAGMAGVYAGIAVLAFFTIAAVVKYALSDVNILKSTHPTVVNRNMKLAFENLEGMGFVDRHTKEPFRNSFNDDVKLLELDFEEDEGLNQAIEASLQNSETTNEPLAKSAEEVLRDKNAQNAQIAANRAILNRNIIQYQHSRNPNATFSGASHPHTTEPHIQNGSPQQPAQEAGNKSVGPFTV